MFYGYSEDTFSPQHSADLQETLEQELLPDLCFGLVISEPPRVVGHDDVATVRSHHVNFTNLMLDGVASEMPLLCDLDSCYDRDGGSNFVSNFDARFCNSKTSIQCYI